MRKFTNINESGAQAPNSDLKTKINTILRNGLSIQNVGDESILEYVSITGIDSIVQNLITLFESEKNDLLKESLTELKNTNRDWKSIDEFIDNITMNKCINLKSLLENVNFIVENYDPEIIPILVTNKIKSKEKHILESYKLAFCNTQRANLPHEIINTLKTIFDEKISKVK